MKYCSSTFRQSLNDFPCSIELGKKIPSFGINRWGVNALRFVPSDDEGFTLKGDKQRLLYKGRQRSHRFTILNDGAFEYDCILLREPESNVITLRMEGAEQYDFFRQPDFVPDDFLKGSYAVYKKETSSVKALENYVIFIDRLLLTLLVVKYGENYLLLRMNCT